MISLFEMFILLIINTVITVTSCHTDILGCSYGKRKDMMSLYFLSLAGLPAEPLARTFFQLFTKPSLRVLHLICKHQLKQSKETG